MQKTLLERELMTTERITPITTWENYKDLAIPLSSTTLYNSLIKPDKPIKLRPEWDSDFVSMETAELLVDIPELQLTKGSPGWIWERPNKKKGTTDYYTTFNRIDGSEVTLALGEEWLDCSRCRAKTYNCGHYIHSK